MTKHATNDRLTISFWIWAIFDLESNPYYADLERRFVELKEREFGILSSAWPRSKAIGA